MLLALSLTCTPNGKSQITYRGFVEGGLGASIISGASGYSEGYGEFRNSNNGGGVGFSYMLATTHGIQLKNNFIGIGLGITPGYCAVGDYRSNNIGTTWDDDEFEYGLTTLSDSRISKVSLPAYINWRYDFFINNSPFKPYVGMKAGIFIPISIYNLDYQVSGRYHEGRMSISDSGMLPFIAIDFGLRKRISDSSGVSFGLCIQNSNDANGNYHVNEYNSWADLEGSLNISILAKVTFDF